MKRPRATILVPAARDEMSLPDTMPLIVRAAGALADPVEIVLITPDGFDPIVLGPTIPGAGVRVRWITSPRAGKFSALHAGVEAAHSDLLVMVDADVVPHELSFLHVLEPLLAGEADACAGRLVLARRPGVGRVGSILERWSEMRFEAWHRLRSVDPSLCWALSGALYAIRRSFFPSTPLVPAVDDASVGLHIREMGGRFRYAPLAFANVLAPTSYWDWVRQNLRTRRGWAVLAAHRPAVVAALRGAFVRHLVEVMGPDRTAWLLRSQDRGLRAVASLSVRLGLVPDGEWRSLRSTKQWGDAASRAAAGAPSLVGEPRMQA